MMYTRLTILLLALLAPAPLAATGGRRITTSLARALSTLSLSSGPCGASHRYHSFYLPQPSMLATQYRSFSAPTWWQSFDTTTPKKRVRPTISLSKQMVLDAFTSVGMNQNDFVFIQKTGIVQKLVNAKQLTALQLIARLNLEIAHYYSASEQKGSAWSVARRIALLKELAKGNDAVLARLEAICKLSYPKGNLNAIGVTKKNIFRAIINSSHPAPYPALLHSREASEMSNELASSLTANFDNKSLSVAAFVINISTIINHFFYGVEERFRRQDERGDGRPSSEEVNSFLSLLLRDAGQADALPEAITMVTMLYPKRSAAADDSDGDDHIPWYVLANSDDTTKKPPVYDLERPPTTGIDPLVTSVGVDDLVDDSEDDGNWDGGD